METLIKIKTGQHKGKWLPRLGDYEGEPRIYRIIRMSFNRPSRTIRNNVTLTEAQNHCQRSDTHGGEGEARWFDGYDYMKGCKPQT